MIFVIVRGDSTQSYLLVFWCWVCIIGIIMSMKKVLFTFLHGLRNSGITNYVNMQKDSKYIKIEVAAYSGYKANERPLYFVVDQQKFQVTKVLDRWYGQDHDYFKVLADDGQVYTLKWHRYLDVWFILTQKTWSFAFRSN
jgi:hypothetical protein